MGRGRPVLFELSGKRSATMSHTADFERDLRFAAIAIRLGLVESGDLADAMDAWARDSSRSLADRLTERGSIAQDRVTAIWSSVAGSTDRAFESGTARDGSGAPGGGRSGPETAFDDLGPRSAETVVGPVEPSPSTVGLETVVSDDGASWVPGVPSEAGVSASGSRYRVLRSHARGGLGEVYVALDGELRRMVALKEIRAHYADEATSRARFIIEAEITGTLEHPGVVPVYGFGHYPDGRPYYAMRFIQGMTLGVAIEKHHAAEAEADPGEHAVAFRALLGRFVDVCDVVAFAHSRGVLHRDLKPDNVMLGRFGETLVVDWGLAKAVGTLGPDAIEGEPPVAPASGGSTVADTMPGSVLGTPAFMSPEQARGAIGGLGPTADLYSLGATLYVLLTGRRAFEGSDRDEVLRKVMAGTFPTPRAVNPKVPRPLEAICLKAMAQRPEGRYQTARALAEDLGRWLADLPVTAWPEPWPLRLRRWSGRHRTLVSSLAVASALLLAFGMIAWNQSQVRRARSVGRATEVARQLGIAEPAAVPPLVRQSIGLLPHSIGPLRELLGAAEAGSTARRRAAMALIPSEPSRIVEVLEHATSDRAEVGELLALDELRGDLGPDFRAAIGQRLADPPDLDRLPGWLRVLEIAGIEGAGGPLGIEAAPAIAGRLEQADRPSERYALLLALGSIRPEGIDPSTIERVLDFYRDDPDPGVHGAASWTLRVQWGRGDLISAIDLGLAGEAPRPGFEWFNGPDARTYTIVPSGQVFRMGTPLGTPGIEPREAAVTRRIARRFAIAATEVTRAQFRRYVEETGASRDDVDQDYYAPEDDAPAISVSWFEAARYCNWLSRLEGFEPCYPDDVGPDNPGPDDVADRLGYRLPTEAEWECACRAGTDTLRPFGDGPTLLDRVAWWSGNAQGPEDPDLRAHPVGQLLPNRWGLFDALGNAAEWCHDAYRPYPEDRPDTPFDDGPSDGPGQAGTRLMRGGSFAYPANAARSALRDFYDPVLINSIGGFRIARTLPGSP